MKTRLKFLISIIVPTYNGKLSLKETLRSICSQTYKNTEIIIIDDNSDDGSQMIVSEFDDKRISYIRNKTNLGPAKSRNLGLKKAQGHIIAYCDHDDIWHKNYLNYIANYFKNNPKASILFCPYRIGIGSVADLYMGYDPHNLSKFFMEVAPIIGMNFSSPSFMSHRSKCIKGKGLFDENRAISYSGEDWEACLRATDAYRFQAIDKIMGTKIYNGKNISCSENNTTNLKEKYRYIFYKRLTYNMKNNDNKFLRSYLICVCFFLQSVKMGNVWKLLKHKVKMSSSEAYTKEISTALRGIEYAFQFKEQDAIKLLDKSMRDLKNRALYDGAFSMLSLVKLMCKDNLKVKPSQDEIKNAFSQKINMASNRYMLKRLILHKEYKKALSISKGFACSCVFNYRGIALHRLGKIEDALGEFEKSLLMAGSYSPARENIRLIKKCKKNLW